MESDKAELEKTHHSNQERICQLEQQLKSMEDWKNKATVDLQTCITVPFGIFFSFIIF